MNKYILGGVVILIILTVIILVNVGTSLRDVPTETNNSATTTTVTYTNDGFKPAELTVKTGTVVTFLNQSDTKMWIASAPHPTHTLYPEFDAKTSVIKGGSYSFTFNKIGTHAYHNHMQLGKYGKIIVE
ncbi:MAG: cupredoxin domain-containing protein [Minisyncoccia bacterium]